MGISGIEKLITIFSVQLCGIYGMSPKETAVNIADELFKAQSAAEQLRSQIKGYLDEANRALMELTDRYINREEFTSADRKGISRALLFEKYERPACRPVGKLPVWSEHFESLKVSRFYTVRINGTQYSVPYVFAGSYVSADIIDGTVHIYSPTGEIATHPRAANGTEKVISPGHMPESHRAEHEKRKKYATDEDILLAAGEFGDRVASLCRSMLAPGQRREARKACIAIINFCKRNRRDAAILSEAARATPARAP